MKRDVGRKKRKINHLIVIKARCREVDMKNTVLMKNAFHQQLCAYSHGVKIRGNVKFHTHRTKKKSKQEMSEGF